MTWIKYITDTSQNKHRGTIHKIYERIHSKVTNTSTLPFNYEGILLTQFISTSFNHWIIIKAIPSSDWTIIKARSSSDWIIIIITASAISSKWCYLSILLIIGSSTELALFHVGCRSWHIYPTMGGPALTSDHGSPSFPPCQKVPTLTSNHGRPILPPCQKGPACNHVRKTQHLHLTMGGPSYYHVIKDQHLHPPAW